MSGILGIENRTENWKTTIYFSPMFGGKSHRLTEMLGATPELPPGEVKPRECCRSVRQQMGSSGKRSI